MKNSNSVSPPLQDFKHQHEQLATTWLQAGKIQRKGWPYFVTGKPGNVYLVFIHYTNSISKFRQKCPILYTLTFSSGRNQLHIRMKKILKMELTYTKFYPSRGIKIVITFHFHRLTGISQGKDKFKKLHIHCSWEPWAGCTLWSVPHVFPATCLTVCPSQFSF